MTDQENVKLNRFALVFEMPEEDVKEIEDAVIDYCHSSMRDKDGSYKDWCDMYDGIYHESTFDLAFRNWLACVRWMNRKNAAQSPSTEVGQQGVESLQKIISNYFKVKPIDYYFGLDSYDLAEHLFSSIKTLEPQPQEVGQDEDARNIIADNLYSISDVFGNRLLPQDKCDEMAETFLSDIKSKFTIIKKNNVYEAMDEYAASLRKENEQNDVALKNLDWEVSALKKENEELKAWKESMISVMPPIQEIGKEIGVGLGESIHDKILPVIQELKSENDILEEREVLWASKTKQLEESNEAKEKECERLKGLLEFHLKSMYDGVEDINDFWQQFKAKNNL